jgi:hypothetical protein
MEEVHSKAEIYRDREQSRIIDTFGGNAHCTVQKRYIEPDNRVQKIQMEGTHSTAEIVRANAIHWIAQIYCVCM